MKRKGCGAHHQRNRKLFRAALRFARASQKWRLAVLLLTAVSAFGSVRLYLKDGAYQIVREYHEFPDRVTYLSAERSGDWEEIPIDLVDLNRTKNEIAENAAKRAKEAREDAEEDNAIREEKRKAASVPGDSGVYYLHGDTMEPLPQADVTAVSDKTRTVLRDLSTIGVVILAHEYPPTPVLASKNTLELEGAASKFRVAEGPPEFYFRLNASDGFAIVRLAPKKDSRVVETLLIAPVTGELQAKRDPLPTFTKQFNELLYKIWPEQSLPPGEYALIEYRDGEGILQVWDFGVGDPE